MKKDIAQLKVVCEKLVNLPDVQKRKFAFLIASQVVLCIESIDKKELEDAIYWSILSKDERLPPKSQKLKEE